MFFFSVKLFPDQSQLALRKALPINYFATKIKQNKIKNKANVVA